MPGVATVAAVRLSGLNFHSLHWLPPQIQDLNVGIVALVVNVIVLVAVSSSIWLLCALARGRRQSARRGEDKRRIRREPLGLQSAATFNACSGPPSFFSCRMSLATSVSSQSRKVAIFGCAATAFGQTIQ